MKKYPLILGAVSIITSSLLAETLEIEKIEVTDRVDMDEANTKNITKANIDNRVGAGQTNPYKALDMQPSVHMAQTDAYGLSLDQNSFRIRGLYADTFGRFALTNDGVPSVVNVGQGAMGSILDMENISSMSFVSGPSNGDSGFGFGNNAGSLDLKTRKALDDFEVYIKQAFGGGSFSRTFTRVDSGKLAYDTKFFISLSHSEVDKFRGKGKSDRDNIEAGMTVPITDALSIDILAAHNDIERNDYRGLTYALASDLSANYDFDFNTELTGSAANDKYYYDFNKQHFKENLVQANIQAKLLEGILSIKPYHIDTDGYRLSYNATSNVVSKMDMEQEQNGVVVRYDKNFAWLDAAIGYWYQKIDTIPPPTGQKSYSINNGQLVFSSWGMLNDIGSREFNSPFLMLKKETDDWKVQAGVRYLEMKLPSIQGYTTTAGDVSYDAAMASATIDPDLHVNEITFKKVLPTLNLSYELSPDMSLNANYAKGYANPWNGPLFSIYKSKKAVFQSHGISLQDIWDTLKLETSDTFDIGMKIKGENWSVEPTLYYSKYVNKQVTVYDPVVNLNYYQSNAQAEGKGFELSALYVPVADVELFSALSYNRLNFTQNLLTTGGALLAVDGNQVPDAPKWLFKVGSIFKYDGFYLSPALKYVDSRYGDILNTQKVPSYTTMDMECGYVKHNVGGFKEISTSLSLQNMLNRKYIAIIKNDLDDSGTNSALYYPGAPFTAMATLALKF
ncbi:MAG: TonB-dependent receptor [Sulfuricurvum sp.]|uniref:TonB-dependent receptor n=1 Tax=Sulfuricurvum sp. TaxID=2025608 RepID=UPI002625364F|nr:TonB-dependent receptor [Sulfuricurvum sp.]MDD5118320.1 TonB-dependent receptor [Sulfuricurvum sp.]